MGAESQVRTEGSQPGLTLSVAGVAVGAPAARAQHAYDGDCITAGASSAAEPIDTANQIWIGVHGQATLLASMPWHPWPADRERFADDIVVRLAQLTPGKSGRKASRRQ